MVSTKHQELDRWLTKVDKHVQEIAGISVWDLPDCPFADWYEDGFSPWEAAVSALDEGGW